VRDKLLGNEPKDYDIVTNAKPEEVGDLFKRTLHVGAAFGVVKVLLGGGFEYEVATYRTDGIYIDGRRPDEVKYSQSAEEDVKRRDFTINALLEDPFTGEIRDYVGGQADLQAGIIRAVGDAKKRVAEDRLRMLRAIRFAARFGFTVDPATMSAIQAHASEITDVSPERISAELEGMWSCPRPGQGLRLLVESGLFPHVLGFASPAAAERLDRLPSAKRDAESTRWLAWAILFSGHDRKTIDQRMRALKLSREHLRSVQMLVGAEPILRSGPAIEVMRLAVSKEASLYRDFAACIGAQDRWEAVERDLIADPLPPLPLITGADLQAMGIPPGPKYKELLEAVETAALSRSVRTKDEALALARTLL
jgi:tRNA nucleotidyltransferase/poly(A) polymerase